MATDDGRVVSNFIVQAFQNKPLTIYGEGEQTRSFCYIDDLIKGLVAMMSSDDFLGPVNLGNPGEFTIKELAHKVIKLTGSKSEIIYESLPSDDPKQRRPDISLAKNKLGWQPEIQLEEGIEKTINYFRGIL
jgi:UDP-glucuronate decarboxylase